jgi:hypothetical protein
MNTCVNFTYNEATDVIKNIGNFLKVKMRFFPLKITESVSSVYNLLQLKDPGIQNEKLLFERVRSFWLFLLEK